MVADDDAILRLAGNLLTDLGYSVLTAATPHEAITVARAAPAPIALLITDVIMPDMNGQRLASTLKETIPDLKTLFMSGYTANVIAHHGVLEEGIDFLPKPFSKKDLAARVHRVLSR